MTNTKTILKQVINGTLLLVATSFASCNGQNTQKASASATEQPLTVQNEPNSILLQATKASAIDKNIRSIFQDSKGNYWFGTNDVGVYRYDGKTLFQFTEKDGLSNNQVQSIQEDQSGTIWFGTGRFGVSSFDGQSFTTHTNKESLQLGTTTDWKLEPNDLWFYAGGGAYRYHGNMLVYLPLDTSKLSQNSPYALSRYAVYSILKDKKGTIWFGTQSQGVGCYDGKSFTWFTEKGLSGSAVLGLFEDSSGNLWFGNNGAGLFKYDGKTLLNFTEEKGLGNDEFKVSGKSGPGTLSRIYTLNEDNYQNLWIGTVDAGVWKYDGKNVTNYTTKDGLTSNAINCIYKDKNGDLWFGTDSDGICKFNGKNFVKFEVE
jgi:ligand-binding sensor domain-containing protein